MIKWTRSCWNHVNRTCDFLWSLTYIWSKTRLLPLQRTMCRESGSLAPKTIHCLLWITGLVLQIYVHIKLDKILFANIFHSVGFYSYVSATIFQQPVCHMWKYLSYEYAEFLSKEDLFSRDFESSMSKEVIMKIRRLFLNSGLIQML